MKRFVLLLALLPATTWAQYHVAVTDATSIKIPVQAIASSDHLTEKTDVSALTCKKSLNGGTTGDCAGTSAEVSDTDQPGTWAYTLHANDVSAAGVLVMRFSATGMDPYRATVQIGNLPADINAINGDATSTNSATLKLKQLDVTNSAGHAIIAKSTNNGSYGLDVESTGTGNSHAMYLTSTNGAGIATSGGSYGVTFGGASAGMQVVASAGPGLLATGGGGGAGISATGDAAGHGLSVTGGATGHGINAQGGATNKTGIWAQGAGTGYGMYLYGGSGGGGGMRIDGGATSGNGVTVGTTSGIGVVIGAGGSDKDGVQISGAGTGDGIQTTGGATGKGLRIVGGATSGAAIEALNTTGDAVTITSGGGDGDAIACAPNGTGLGLNCSLASIGAGGIASTSFGTGAITAASIAADAIGASELAADAITSSELAASAASEIATTAGSHQRVE